MSRCLSLFGIANTVARDVGGGGYVDMPCQLNHPRCLDVTFAAKM